jgi:hypothetical protein
VVSTYNKLQALNVKVKEQLAAGETVAEHLKEPEKTGSKIRLGQSSSSTQGYH